MKIPLNGSLPDQIRSFYFITSFWSLYWDFLIYQKGYKGSGFHILHCRLILHCGLQRSLRDNYRNEGSIEKTTLPCQPKYPCKIDVEYRAPLECSFPLSKMISRESSSMIMPYPLFMAINMGRPGYVDKEGARRDAIEYSSGR
jgi:hypothetical protein